MATLSAADQQRVANALYRLASRVDGAWGIPNSVASDWLSAVQATDSWIDTNQSAYNNTLPSVIRDNASVAQKTIFFCAVALARVSITWLVRLFGEVD